MGNSFVQIATAPNGDRVRVHSTEYGTWSRSAYVYALGHRVYGELIKGTHFGDWLFKPQGKWAFVLAAPIREGSDAEAGIPGGSPLHQTQNDGSVRALLDLGA